VAYFDQIADLGHKYYGKFYRPSLLLSDKGQNMRHIVESPFEMVQSAIYPIFYAKRTKFKSGFENIEKLLDFLPIGIINIFGNKRRS